MSEPEALGEALVAWAAVVGAAHVDRGERLAAANRTTLGTSTSLLAVIAPANRDEVAACLRVAADARIPLYPVSTGRNWGYGSAAAPRNGCVLLSLARLGGLRCDEASASVTVEPGVTFRRLAGALGERGSRLLPPTTGSSPDTSVVGAILERGIGKWFYEDLAGRASAYEALLATGETVRVDRARAGPALHGLFNQSNFGVVTNVTLALEPAPVWRQTVVLHAGERERLGAVLVAVRALVQRTDARRQIELINDYKLLTQTRRYPYDEFDGSSELPRAWVERATGASGWFGGVTLWADDDAELAARRAALERALGPFARSMHVEEPVAGAQLTLSDDGLASAYWRKREPMPLNPDPDRDGCGVVWVAPALPPEGASAARAVGALEAAVLEHGFEPSMSLRFVNSHAPRAVLGVLYDRDESGADDRAERCCDALYGVMRAHGLEAYRVPVTRMREIAAPSAGTATILRAIKTAADPFGVVAPGRYSAP